MNGRIHRNFTLIELMAVMLLMGVLMVMMLPAFNRMIRGNKVDQVTSNLKLGLEQAQSLAATSRKYVALVLPNNRDDWNTDDTKSFCNGGYRLAYVTKVSGTEWKFTKWTPDSKWTNAPDGAMLVEAVAYVSGSTPSTNSAGGVTNVVNAMDDSISVGNVLHDISGGIQGGPSGTASGCAIVFNPYGGIENAAIALVVAEAVSVSGAANSKIIYPVRAEASNPNELPTNFQVLSVNKFTGKVEFVTL